MRAIFALVLGLVLVGPAQAIVVDSGFLSGGLVNDFSPLFDMHGDGFSVTGIDFTGGNPLPFQMTGSKSVTTPVDLSSTAEIRSRLDRHIVIVPNGTPFPDFVPGGVTYNGQFFNTGSLTGALTFDVEPFLLTVTFPPGPDATGESPFTMTGSLSFDGQTVELEGAGTVQYFGHAFGPGTAPTASPTSLRFDFAPVPEPATLTLVGTVGGLGALCRWRKRRAEPQSRLSRS
jgi:PEP-CTERM motif